MCLCHLYLDINPRPGLQKWPGGRSKNCHGRHRIVEGSTAIPVTSALILLPSKLAAISARDIGVRRHQRVFAGGDLVEFYEAPEVCCTSICFGGDGMRSAVVTLSGTGRLIAVDWPRVGLSLNDPLTARGCQDRFWREADIRRDDEVRSANPATITGSGRLSMRADWNL